MLAIWACIVCTPLLARAFPPLPEAMWDQLVLHTTLIPGSASAPGRLPANATTAVRGLFFTQNKARHVSYEIIFPDQRLLALAVFSLAVHAGDVPNNMDAQRFFRSVQGFHYSIAQVCTWRTDLARSFKELPPEAAHATRWFMQMLEEDQIISNVSGQWQGTGTVSHVLGAARGEKRSLARNLRHERLHVLWDEDADMRQKAHVAWGKLTPHQRKQALQSLQGYSTDNALLLEEWAVRRLE